MMGRRAAEGPDDCSPAPAVPLRQARAPHQGEGPKSMMVDTQSVADLSLSLQRFGWPDYLVFAAMLALCTLIGIYFGFWAPGNKDEAEYLMGGRQMNTLPIALSLVASYISGITLIGVPTEVYVYGMQILYAIPGALVFGFVFVWTALPVFHNLQLISLYEYLQMRFDRRVRFFGSVSFTISMIAWLPIVIYVPALAFNQVTGVNVHVVAPAVCAVCVFYTCVGGLKAVVWTDVVQTVSMYGCILLVAVLATINVGGIDVVFRRALESGRLEAPLLDVDPEVRQTLWACVTGAFCNLMVSSALNQAMMQRYLALPTLRSAKRSVYLFVIGIIILTLFCAYCGFLIYATYHNCDPVTTKLARQKDQLLPLLVMETLGRFPGLPGLFVAGVFSAALSSLSTGLNSLSAVVVEDFWRPMMSSAPSERSVYLLMRGVVLVFGAIFVGLVFIVEKLGVVLQLAGSLSSISNGPMMAVFVAALFLPWVNSTGCLIGASVGLVFMCWLVLGAQYAIAYGLLTFPEKPVSIDGCMYHFNTTLNESSASFQQSQPPLWLFRISYQWYTLVGMLVSLSVALIVSPFFFSPKDDLNPNLFSPLIRGILLRRQPQKVKIMDTPTEKDSSKFQQESSL